MANAIKRSGERRGNRRDDTHTPNANRIGQSRDEAIGENANEPIGGQHHTDPRQREAEIFRIGREDGVKQRIAYQRQRQN